MERVLVVPWWRRLHERALGNESVSGSVRTKSWVWVDFDDRSVGEEVIWRSESSDFRFLGPKEGRFKEPYLRGCQSLLCNCCSCRLGTRNQWRGCLLLSQKLHSQDFLLSYWSASFLYHSSSPLWKFLRIHSHAFASLSHSQHIVVDSGVGRLLLTRFRRKRLMVCW